LAYGRQRVHDTGPGKSWQQGQSRQSSGGGGLSPTLCGLLWVAHGASVGIADGRLLDRFDIGLFRRVFHWRQVRSGWLRQWWLTGTQWRWLFWHDFSITVRRCTGSPRSSNISRANAVPTCEGMLFGSASAVLSPRSSRRSSAKPSSPSNVGAKIRDSGEIERQGEKELIDDEFEKRQRFFRLRPSNESCRAPGRDGAWLFHPPDVWRRRSPRLRWSERRSPYRREPLP
jgi:hypothetical protein